MSAGLSLSGALGGLRIANPDDDEEAVASPLSPYEQPSYTRPPPLSSHSSGDTITNPGPHSLLGTLSHESPEHESGGLGFNPESYMHMLDHGGDSQPTPYHAAASPVVPHANTLPQTQRLSHRSSVPLNHQAQEQMQYTQQSTYPPAQPRKPSAQSTSTRTISSMYQQPNASSSSTGSYRYREDMDSSNGGISGLGRSDSRSNRAFAPGPVPSRESSRNYRSSSQPMAGGNGPLPPRRNSRRARAATAGSGVGYEPYSSSVPEPGNADEWRERGAAVAPRQETDSTGHTQTRITKKGVKDFNFGRTLGEGSYSTVLAATDRQNLKEYAIKVLDKRHIIKEKKVKYVNIERDTLNRLTDHPGIVRLYYTFQDERSLYFVLDLASSGELLGVLKKMGSFDVECTRFYGAQILDSIAYIHSRGVIHRDLKPENVLLDRDMHTKITDFGTAKILPDPKQSGAEMLSRSPIDDAENDRANSFVGTAEYVSPELLQRSNACKASDLWAFGCIIYQMLTGRPPFKAANEYLTFQKILSLEFTFPDSFPPVARDLVERLLVLDPANRLPVEHIQNHQFFDGVQWGKSLWRQKAPRLKAYVPPPAEPIKLNGANTSNVAFMPPLQTQTSTPQPRSQDRPNLRGVTDLPPPSQLDIDWSPVLTNNNERILKLGNLIVSASPQDRNPTGANGDPGTPSEKSKFRFFSGNKVTKRRERLVLITSSCRVVIAAAGGNEKKAKMELNCLASGTSWRRFVDAKALTAWQLDTRKEHLTFEDPRATTSDPAGSKYSTQEWLEALENAREIAMATSLASSYSYNSTASTPSEGDAAMPLPPVRHTLRKHSDHQDKVSGGKRFSKRHSKSGLAAVF